MLYEVITDSFQADQGQPEPGQDPWPRRTAAAEKRTLLVDMDPQANACSGVGIDKRAQELTIYNALLGEATARDILVKSDLDRLDIRNNFV